MRRLLTRAAGGEILSGWHLFETCSDSGDKMTAHRAPRGRRDADRLVLDRLTPLDVSNLRIERHGLPMNVAALTILEGRRASSPLRRSG